MDITKLAALARIKLSSDEEKELSNEFEAILKYVDQIKEAQIDDQVTSGEISMPMPLNIMREDANANISGEMTEDLLSLSPDREGNYIKVKKIL
jgi:aspartyl/glutamyl-tRNA(Asn/Gln) amidotransferase C subunit